MLFSPHNLLLIITFLCTGTQSLSHTFVLFILESNRYQVKRYPKILAISDLYLIESEPLETQHTVLGHVILRFESQPPLSPLKVTFDRAHMFLRNSVQEYPHSSFPIQVKVNI